MDLKISLEIHATQVIYTNLDHKVVLQLKAQDLDKEKYGAAATTFIAVSIAPQDNNITRGQFYYLQPVYHIIQIMFFTIVFMSKLIRLVLTHGNKNSITELMMLYVLFTLHWSERK